MSRNIFKYILSFVLLVLLQGLILNKVVLFDYVHLYVYVIFLITLPCKLSRELALIVGFLLGLSVDIFANTFGIHAFASVLVVFLRPFLLSAFAPRDDRADIVPSIAHFGFINFLKYSSVLIIVHNSALFIADHLSFIYIGNILLKISLSSIATIAILMTIEKIKAK